MEQLESFGLPATFPAHMMPQAGVAFIANCPKGLSKNAILRLARERGFMPTWRRLEHLGAGVYGLALTIDGCGVPLMVRMRHCEEPSTPAIRIAEQQSLF